MNREILIQSLKLLAPKVVQITGTQDMGYEFSAVVPRGFVYPEPGMLLNYSGGIWPPSNWNNKDTNEWRIKLADFLLDERWEVVEWPDIDDEDLELWLNDIKTTATEP